MSDWFLPPVIIEDEPSDFRTLKWSWGPDKLKLSETNDAAQGEGVLVCVLDTAGQLDHRELPKPIDQRIFTGESSGFDQNAHGSHVSGTIHEWSPKSDLAIYKVLRNNGSGSTTGIANAIRYVTHKWVNEWRDKDYAFVIVNMSLGGSFAQDIDNAMRDGVEQGVLYICAAGNSGNSGTDHPGNSRFSALTVGAFDNQLRPASFSSRGPAVNIAMPGVNINSTIPNNRFQTMSGTSMATPGASGLVARMLSSRPQDRYLRDYRNLQPFIYERCQDLHTPGRDTATGFGFPIPSKVVDFTPYRFF